MTAAGAEVEEGLGEEGSLEVEEQRFSIVP